MKKNTYLQTLENSGILVASSLTPEQYREELKQFQKMICDIVAENTGETVYRIDDAIVWFEKSAREKGVLPDPRIKKGITTMRTLKKELAIMMSGKCGENRVAKRLEYINHPTHKYRNVYVSNDESETELDNVILTQAGLVILEVKSTKADITITESGRLYFNEECHDDESICEKMERKRNLLKEELTKKMKDRGIDIPIQIDSFIVFSTPKDTFVKITDRCRKEKYCFQGPLPYRIDEFVVNPIYSDEQFEELRSIMDEMAVNQKKFDLKLDFDCIRREIADAFQLCYGELEEEHVTKDIVTFNGVTTFINRLKSNKRALAFVFRSAASLTLFATGFLATSLPMKRI